MTMFQALILGLIQGLSEFLPISSSAHLTLAPWAFGWKDPGLAFDVALHMGTLVAVLWYFRAEWGRLILAGIGILRTRRVRTTEEWRVVLLVIATIPAAAWVSTSHAPALRLPAWPNACARSTSSRSAPA